MAKYENLQTVYIIVQQYIEKQWQLSTHTLLHICMSDLFPFLQICIFTIQHIDTLPKYGNKLLIYE